MVLFKINGERNSGTNFLTNVLKQNKFPTYVEITKQKICYHWKHGIPREDVKLLNDKVIDIFIFRTLEEWLISMYHNVYQLKRMKNFHNFLTTNQQSVENRLLDYKTNECLNADDNNKTIFEIRYYKFKKIMEYKENNKNIIFVNLGFLQCEENLVSFLQQLNDKYMNNSINNNYITKFCHTKIRGKNNNNNTDLKNRVYNIDLENYKEIINNHKNEEIETFINNITIDIF